MQIGSYIKPDSNACPLTYRFVTHGSARGIMCLVCGMTSWHQRDVQERYCVHCNVFHEDLMTRLGGSATRF